MGISYFSRFQKLPTAENNSRSHNNKTIEENLIETGQWALFSIRLPGYLPLTTTRSSTHGLRLELKLCSLATFYTTLVTCISVLGSGVFAHTFVLKFIVTPEKAGPATEAYGNVESFVWASMIFLVTYTTYLRCSRIFYCQGSLGFWRKTVGMVERVQESGYVINSNYFSSIHSGIRNWAVLYQCGAVARVSYSAYLIYIDLEDPCVTPIQMSVTVLDLFLGVTLCCHVGYSVWLTFLIKIYSMCFSLVHDDLDGMTCVRGAVTRRGQKDAGDDYTNFYSLFDAKTKDVDLEKDKESEGLLDIEHRIQTTLQTYEMIEDHMHEFNAYFGVTLIMETLFALVLVVVDVYCAESFLATQPVYVLLVMVTPIAIFSMALYNFSSESSQLSGKATGILKKLEKFFVPNCRPELQILQLKIVALIARVADNPPTISAAHYFTMNRHLLSSFVGTITTYLIVLLQFRDAPAAGVEPNPVDTLIQVPCPTDMTRHCGKCVNITAPF